MVKFGEQEWKARK